MSAERGAPHRHLALVAYRWGMGDQSRLLVSCLAPAVADLRARGLHRFWFDRFDARGPHVFALFTVAAERLDEVRGVLAERVERFMGEHPSRVELTDGELRRRHDDCRGKALCSLDAEPGFAANDSVRFCEQPASGYPFGLGLGLARPERLWDLWDRLTQWTVERLRRDPESARTGAAAAWMASLSRVLPQHCEAPRDYWLHHASSVIPRFELPGDAAEAADRLTRALGAANAARLAAVWELHREGDLPWPDLPDLVELVAGADPTRGAGPEALLREIVHVTLKQLAVPIRTQRPLLLQGLRDALTAAP